MDCQDGGATKDLLALQEKREHRYVQVTPLPSVPEKRDLVTETELATSKHSPLQAFCDYSDEHMKMLYTEL